MVKQHLTPEDMLKMNNYMNVVMVIRTFTLRHINFNLSEIIRNSDKRGHRIFLFTVTYGMPMLATSTCPSHFSRLPIRVGQRARQSESLLAASCRSWSLRCPSLSAGWIPASAGGVLYQPGGLVGRQ